MTVERLRHIPGFNIDNAAAVAGDDPDVLRMENLDTDLAPPAVALQATRAAVGEDEANSWLPFNGRAGLKQAVAEYIQRRGGPAYDPVREIVMTCGEGEAMLDALFCLTELNRVRLAGAEPRLVPLQRETGEWRLDLDALAAAAGERTRVVFVNNASQRTRRAARVAGRARTGRLGILIAQRTDAAADAWHLRPEQRVRSPRIRRNVRRRTRSRGSRATERSWAGSRFRSYSSRWPPA